MIVELKMFSFKLLLLHLDNYKHYCDLTFKFFKSLKENYDVEVVIFPNPCYSNNVNPFSENMSVWAILLLYSYVFSLFFNLRFLTFSYSV